MGKLSNDFILPCAKSQKIGHTMKYRSLGLAALLGSSLLITACTEEAQENLDKVVITIDDGRENNSDSSDNDSSSDNSNLSDDNEPVLTPAELQFPIAGTVISNQTIVIAPSHNDASLWLDVGIIEGGESLFNSAITGPTQVSNIPLNGQPIFISLWTQISGEWEVNKYRFDTSSVSESKPDDSDNMNDENSNSSEVIVNSEIQSFDGNYIVQAGSQVIGSLKALDLKDSELTFEVTSEPTKGSVQVNPANGQFTYQAGNQSAGSKDAFAFRVFDGETYSPPGIVRITYSSHAGQTVQGRTDGVGADLVIVAEGFTQADMPAFHEAVDDYIDFMFSYEDEFKAHQKAWNIHRVDLVSQESGSDASYGTNTINTALDSGFNCSNIQRLLCVNASKTFEVVNNTYPQWDNILVIVNSTTYGGAGYSSGIGTVSMASAAKDVALHEMAHSFAGLGDEYTYGGSSAPTREPSASNLTINNNSQTVKWSHWIGVDSQVGLYEGGKYVSSGVWRPTNNSMMRSLGQPFHSVNKEAWTLSVYEHGGVVLNQLPSSNEVSQLKGESTQFYIDPLMSVEALTIEWFLNGQKLDEFSGETQVILGKDQSDNFNVLVKVSDATGTIIKDPQNHSSDEVRWSVSVQ